MSVTAVETHCCFIFSIPTFLDRPSLLESPPFSRITGDLPTVFMSVKHSSGLFRIRKWTYILVTQSIVTWNLTLRNTAPLIVILSVPTAANSTPSLHLTAPIISILVNFSFVNALLTSVEVAELPLQTYVLMMLDHLQDSSVVCWELWA